MTCVLVVDDKRENRYLLRAMLSAHGFEIMEAEHGAAALVEARHRPPDVVISDLLMPVMDGYTLLRHWKGDPLLREAPFIVYTATYTDAKDEQLARDLGADAFIVKPADPEAFIQQVSRVLAEARTGRHAVRAPAVDDQAALKLYSEALVRKLEQKNEQLEQNLAEITASRQRVERLNRLYLALSATNQAIVHCRDRDSLFQIVCRIAVEHGGMTMAWIGMLDEPTQEIIPIACAGDCQEWLESMRPFSLRSPRRAPVEMALGEDQVFLSNDLDNETALLSLREMLRQKALRSAASCPLHVGGRAVGALTLFAGEKNYFDDRMRDLVIEMTDDLSFALDNFEREEQRQRAEQRLCESEEFIRLASRAIEATANGILITSLSSQPPNAIIYVNPAFERITGYSAKDVVGHNPASFLYGQDSDQIGVAEIHAAVRDRREAEMELRNYRQDGSPFWSELTIAPVRDAAGLATHYVGVINDITDRKRYEEQLERQNNEDALTGLASRNLLRDRTGQAIAFAARHDRAVALLVADLADFKRINDSLGHGVGDTVLRAAAERIAGCIRERDTLARLGGDEFVILLSDLAGLQDAPLMAARILRALERPLEIAGRSISISACIGVSVFPQDGADYDTLLRNADAAMYSAKGEGGNTFRFYATSMNEAALRRLELESRLRQALARDELELHYQPLIGVGGGPIGDAEALLRWRSEGRLVSPADFIPLAEDTGLIVAIGEWVLRAACRQARLWQQAGHELRISVNLSARQFRDRNLAEMVRRCLKDNNLQGHLLKLEITETAVMENAEEAADVLAELKTLGVGISVDDFGTGYSSFAYLRRFPIDQLKIDRSFVQDMIDHPDSAAIVQGIIDLARSLHLQTVAEGVETEQQRQFLVRAGCDLMQGFLFSRPLPVDELRVLLEDAGTGLYP